MINLVSAQKEAALKEKTKQRISRKYPIMGLLLLLLMVGAYVFRDLPYGQIATTLFSSDSKKLMQRMKSKGCVADGLLTGFGGDINEKANLLARTRCEFLHRSVETWNTPPDFTQIEANLRTIRQRSRTDFIWGFFLAEAINTSAEYPYPAENRNFDFKAMCSPGTEGDWGPKTCKPSFNKPEYRKYLRYITQRAIDMGFEDFTFGQVYYQDDRYKTAPVAEEIVEEMKKYAKSRNKTIVVGAQTNTIDNEKYLRIFDYITGGVGQDQNGNIENGPCWSFLQKNYNYCWAMMWHPQYRQKANNILIYLDWNNDSTDDMNRFVRMAPEARQRFLKKAYEFFLAKEMGFLLPLEAVLDGSGRSCYGAAKNFYSASNSYSCKDEGAINEILSHSIDLKNDASFVSAQIPDRMVAGKEHQLSITMKNTSSRIWSKEEGFQLGLEDSPKDLLWSKNRIDLALGQSTLPGENQSFSTSVIAPANPGTYEMQWKMIKDNDDWFGSSSLKKKVEVIPVPSNPSHAINGPVCVNKQLKKCNAWCTAPGATCDAQTGAANCAGLWYDEKGYQRNVECCLDPDCAAGGKCVENVCDYSTPVSSTAPVTTPLPAPPLVPKQ